MMEEELRCTEASWVTRRQVRAKAVGGGCAHDV
jgi:hypothetical protein